MMELILDVVKMRLAQIGKEARRIKDQNLLPLI